MSKTIYFSVAVVVFSALLIECIRASEEPLLKEPDEQVDSLSSDKYIAVPKSLIRLLITDTRYAASNSKRAGSPLSYNADVMSLGGFGKRGISIEPISGGFGKRSKSLDMEPLYGRYGSRFMPRMSDIGWSPYGAYDSLINGLAYN